MSVLFNWVSYRLLLTDAKRKGKRHLTEGGRDDGRAGRSRGSSSTG